MLQDARVTVFTVSQLLRENQREGKITPAPPPTQIGLSSVLYKLFDGDS